MQGYTMRTTVDLGIVAWNGKVTFSFALEETSECPGRLDIRPRVETDMRCTDEVRTVGTGSMEVSTHCADAHTLRPNTYFIGRVPHTGTCGV